LSEAFIEKAATDAYGVGSLDELEKIGKEEALTKTRNDLKQYMIIRRLGNDKGVIPEREEVENFRRTVIETEGVQISYSAAYDYVLKRKLAKLLFGAADDGKERQEDDAAGSAILNDT
jgi:hypothetical protein